MDDGALKCRFSFITDIIKCSQHLNFYFISISILLSFVFFFVCVAFKFGFLKVLAHTHNIFRNYFVQFASFSIVNINNRASQFTLVKLSKTCLEIRTILEHAKMIICERERRQREKTITFLSCYKRKHLEFKNGE